ncbi:MAG TPA: phosphate ABC transporter permease PstA [Acidothermaceae bacterium]|jgi:phosphate transport system permease protein
MTQLDGSVPWQRYNYEPELSVHTSAASDFYGTSPGYVETVDPYLGTLRSYPQSDAEPAPQPARTMYIDLSSPTSLPTYQTVYSWDRATIDPLDPSYDVFAAAGQSAVVTAPSMHEYPAVPATYEYTTAPATYVRPPESHADTAPPIADAYTSAPVDGPVVIDDTATLQTYADPDQTYVAASIADVADQPSNGAPPRSDFRFRNNTPARGDVPPLDGTPHSLGVSDSPRALRARSVDDRLSWWGAAVGGLALAFIVYDRLLPFQGVVGFVIVYQLFRLALLGTVTALSHPRPVVIDRLATAAIRLGARLVFGALAWTIGFVILRGWRTLHHVAFYTHTMAGVLPQGSVNQGGVLHALIGSGVELAIATTITLPLGIMTAVYMTEVGGKLAQIVRTVIEAMTSLPDLLAGLFIYTLLIIGLGFDRSGLAAALALAITMLPLVARSAEVALRVVPAGLRDAGVALGSTQWRTVLQVVLPTAAPGLATALIIAVARAVGETAPVLITSGASTFMNVNPVHNPMNSLPLFIYASLRSGEPNNIARGFGAAVLLLVVVVIFFVLIRLVASRSVKTR